MNDRDSSEDRPRPTAVDDRFNYRFQDYEDAAGADVPAAFERNQPFVENLKRPAAYTADEKHLDQLSLGFKVYAAINALFYCLPIIHLVLGIMMVSGAMDTEKDAPPAFFGWFFIVLALAFMIFGWAQSACSFYAGRFLKERRNYTFCFIMSCVNCAFMPLGTILGVFGIILLMRDSVKDLFQEKP